MPSAAAAGGTWIGRLALLHALGVLIPLALLRRDRSALGFQLGTLAVIAGPLLVHLPVPTEPAPAGKRVRVLAYNIEAGLKGFAGVDQALSAFRTDVVVFTEARDAARAVQLTRELDRRFQGWHQHRAGDVLVESRWPIRRSIEKPLPGSTDRGLTRVRVVSPHRSFDIVGAHLSKALNPAALLPPDGGLPHYLERAARDTLR